MSKLLSIATDYCPPKNPAVEKIDQEFEALHALIKGKQEGLDYFFTRYYPSLIHFARRLVNDYETARDIAEDAFVRLWQRRNEIDHTGSIKAYLYTAVRNGCIDLLRREKYWNEYLNDQAIHGELFETTVLHHIIEAETYQQILQVIHDLPRQCGRVFRLFYIEGLALSEIAEEMDLSLSTIKSQKARAIKLLRQRLPAAMSLLLILIFFLF